MSGAAAWARSATWPLVAVVLAGWGAVDALVVGWSSPAPVSVAVALLAGLPVAGLVRHPYLVATGVTSTLVVHAVVWTQPEAPPETLTLFAVAFGIGAYAAPSYSRWGLLVLGALAVQLRDLDDPGLGGVLFTVGCWVVSLAVGRAVAQRKQAERRHQLLADSTRRASAEIAAAALAAERQRIARDLHDVVTRSVAVMVERAAQGRDAVVSAPGTAEAALLVVEETGQQALTDLRRMLGVMRGATDSPGPQPGLAALPTLADAHGAVLSRHGDLVGVPDGPSVAAFRIVQDALSDDLLPAPGPGRRVAVARAGHGLTIEVTGPGTPPRGWSEGPGVGGMRRRATMYAGTLDATRTPVGWCVRAVLTL